MHIARPGQLVERLVGRNASTTQVALILVPAMVAGLLCGQILVQENRPDWVIAFLVLLVFDLVRGCIACSLPPLQRLHRTRYHDPLKQAGFQLGHIGHAIVIAWLLTEAPGGAIAMSLTLLLLGSLGGAMCSPSIAQGFRVVVTLAWPAYAYALPGSSELFAFLSLILAFKLFVAFPSFRRDTDSQDVK